MKFLSMCLDVTSVWKQQNTKFRQKQHQLAIVGAKHASFVFCITVQNANIYLYNTVPPVSSVHKLHLRGISVAQSSVDMFTSPHCSITLVSFKNTYMIHNIDVHTSFRRYGTLHIYNILQNYALQKGYI